MNIVEVDQIPDLFSITDVPLDDPMMIYKTCQDLESLCDKQQGVGISAVQAGIPWKLFLVKGDGSCPFIPRNEYGYFINCDYSPITEERHVSLEGCLSLRSPDGRLRFFQVERYNRIKLSGIRLLISNKLVYSELEEEVTFNQHGAVFQHEVDHQRGVLISDIGKEVFFW